MVRSILYVPADSKRFVEKAHTRDADCIALDLEDSVVPERKRDARDYLATAVPMAGRSGARVLVRVNSEPERLRQDAEAACRAGAQAIILPKVRSPEDVLRLAGYLEPVERAMARGTATRIVALIEDANAIFEARAIAKSHPRVLGLIAGGEDLATSIGAEPIPEVLLLPKLMVHFSAKAAGVLSLGLMSTVSDYSDLDGMRNLAETGRKYGFDGATCIHPSVVPILNEAFVPSAEEIGKACEIVEAARSARAAGKGAFTLHGRMIDPPIVKRAELLLVRAEGSQNAPWN